MTHRPGVFRTLRGLAASSIVVLAGCWTSPKPELVASTDRQRGLTVTLRMTDGVAHTGELLAVRDSSIVLLLGERIAVAPVIGIDRIIFGADGWPVDGNDAGMLEHARSVSRFPYGISPAALSTLLRHAGQDAPVPLRAGTP
jgi:hypothetical protein